MAGNIYGYQGVHTPLESVTQGRYTLADYTSMRTELTSRLIALENQGGFVPTNVEITGYLHMLPGGAGMGEIETTSSITGESLYINSEAQVGSLQCNNNATVGGTTTFAGNVTVNGGAILSGNGSGLTNINDITKLPLTGGNISGNLGVGGTVSIVGYAGSGQNNPMVHLGDSLLLGINGSQTQELTLTTWSNTTSGLHLTPSSVLLGAGGSASYYPSASIGCSGTTVTLTGNTTTAGNITVSAPGKFIGDGSLLTGVTSTASDPTKLPLAGGLMSGTITAHDINFEVNFAAQNYKRNAYFEYENLPSGVYTPSQNTKSNHDLIVLVYNNTCTVNLQNLNCDNDSAWQDGMRTVTIIKRAQPSTFTVTVLPPTGYTFTDGVVVGASSYTLAGSIYTASFMLTNQYLNSGPGVVYLISKL